MSKVLIDRELLERVVKADASIGASSVDLVDGWEAMAKIRAILASPIQQGEAVEVVAWQDAENPLYTTAERRVMHEWANNQYPIVELMTVAQHQRILEGVRQQLAERDADIIELARGANAIQDALEQQRDKLAEALRRGVDHVTSARHDVEVRANAGNEAAKLVLAGIDSWLINDARAALSEPTP